MAISSGNLLQYEVREKKGKAGVTESIATLIRSKFSKKSGIVYCLSRAECDSTADDLRGYGIKAEAYHAGLTGLVTNSTISVGNCTVRITVGKCEFYKCTIKV